MAQTQNPYDILFDPSVNPYVSPRSGPIRRNPITTQPTAVPTTLGGLPIYTWPDGTTHNTPYVAPAPPPTPAPSVAPPAPPPAPLTPEQAGWFGRADQSYRWFGDLATKNYYEQHPSEAYQQAITSGFGERDTNLKQFALSRYQQSLGDYDLLNESNPNTMYVDSLTPNLMNHIRSLFYDQTAAQKGYVNAWLPAGRMG